jgi:sodium/potassium/calcium exchanger 6
MTISPFPAAISEAVMGVTVLAWGNSTGDLFADMSISRAGAPSMAIAAVFAGPLFNLLVGTGIALLIATSVFIT